MHQSIFFKLFPPPKFLLMPHVGIDISDDAIAFVEHSRPVGDRTILKYGRIPLPVGVVENGDIKDDAQFISILTKISHEHILSYAKVSIPEEKAYLFETEIPYGDFNTISQNIEFKLEENIPIAAQDTVFSFDLLPGDRAKPWRASVSAVPRMYIERMTNLLGQAGITPVAFETVPKALARIVSYAGREDIIVIHVMDHKTGVYVISEQAVGFTSTIGSGFVESDMSTYTDALAAEVRRVYSYWLSKTQNESSTIKKVIVTGRSTEEVVSNLHDKVSDIVSVDSVSVWQSTLDMIKYVPPIDKVDSFYYGPAAGLAL